MNINCLIIDDEPIARDIMESYLEPFNQISVIGSCNNAIEASQLFHEQSVDLIFLDIEMPYMDGLSFLRNMDYPPKVIITTAYREYALEGYELNVVDYLLKPVSQERFLKALNRILINPGSNKAQYNPYIYLKVDMKMVQVFLDEILYIQGLSNYVRIFCQERTLITYQKLSHLEEVFPKTQFMRSHRSYIVNISKIKSYTSSDLNIGDTEIPIGGSYRESLTNLLEKFQA